jgi:hypothetical protein
MYVGSIYMRFMTANRHLYAEAGRPDAAAIHGGAAG